MAARPTHDLTVKTGEYQDGSGTTKGRWLKIGTVFSHDDGGTSIKLECLPVGLSGWDGWVSVFPHKDKDGGDNRAPRAEAARGAQHRPAPNLGGRGAPPAQNSFDDDIPF